MYERFQALLDASGKTIYQVCKETGIKESTLYMWKQRKGTITLETAIKLAKYFGVSVEELYEGDSP